MPCVSAGQVPRWRLNLERQTPLEILYLLIPLSAVLVLAILGIFGWAVHRGQFEDIDHEGERILQEEPGAVDAGQEAHVKTPR